MRFFCDPLPDVGESAVLSEDIRRHARVLRLQVGDVIELFCEGMACRATVIDFDKEFLVRVVDVSVQEPLNPAPITLVQALPKAKKLDAIVRMAVEIGVDTVQLVDSERTVPQWSSARATEKIARLQRISQEATRQSNQQRVARILAPRSIIEVAQGAPSTATRILFWEASCAPLPVTLPRAPIWIAIGPEGGWSQREAHTLRECGWIDASLPTGILRVQTAAPVALAIVRDRLTRALMD